MVFVKVNDSCVDGCFYHLEKFLGMLDHEVSEIVSRIDKSSDPDTDGLCDLGEYFIGYGFVAMQRYFISTYPQVNISKEECLKKGYQLDNSLSLIEVINAGANYWKHEPEWPFCINVDFEGADENDLYPITIDRSGKNLNKNQKRTYEIISQVTPYADYTLSNLLAIILEKISADKALSFSPILPFIEEWRNEISHSEKNSQWPLP